MARSRPWIVHVGNCRDVLAGMPENSVHAIVTDSPYGLSDVLDPPDLTREKLWARILAADGGKDRPPIAHYLRECVADFSAREGREPSCWETADLTTEAVHRRDADAPALDRLIRSWLDTGENPPLSGAGFMGNEWDLLVPAPNTWRASWRVLMPGGAMYACGAPRMYALLELSIRLARFEIDDVLAWLYGQGFPKRVALDRAVDQALGRVKDRPKLRRRPRPSKTAGIYGGMAPPEEQAETGPATPEAARFVGWDRHLRPAYEPIAFAYKPIATRTIGQNVLSHGTGGICVDAARIPRGDGGPLRRDQTHGMGYGKDGARQGTDHGPCGHSQDERGGYPANVVIDEVVADMLDAESGISRAGVAVRRNLPEEGAAQRIDVKAPTQRGPDVGFGDEGGTSRYFYTAKAPTSERDAGLETLPRRTGAKRTRRKEGSAGVNAYAGARGEGARNPHETVKPVALMRWLVRLACPPGRGDPDEARRPIVLDPFAGSGTTLVAALVEGARAVGVEMDEKFARVCRMRCQHAYALPREVGDAGEASPPPDIVAGAQAPLFPAE